MAWIHQMQEREREGDILYNLSGKWAGFVDISGIKYIYRKNRFETKIFLSS